MLNGKNFIFESFQKLRISQIEKTLLNIDFLLIYDLRVTIITFFSVCRSKWIEFQILVLEAECSVLGDGSGEGGRGGERGKYSSIFGIPSSVYSPRGLFGKRLDSRCPAYQSVDCFRAVIARVWFHFNIFKSNLFEESKIDLLKDKKILSEP